MWDSVANGTSEWLARSLPIAKIDPVIPHLENPLHGAGRICEVNEEITLKDAIERIKSYTNLPDLRVTVSPESSLESKISNFACCPGKEIFNKLFVK